MSRNRCFGLKKYSITKKEEAKRKMKKIKKKTLSYKRKKQLDAVNGKH
jgi:ribosomal protein S4E